MNFWTIRPRRMQRPIDLEKSAQCWARFGDSVRFWPLMPAHSAAANLVPSTGSEVPDGAGHIIPLTVRTYGINPEIIGRHPLRLSSLTRKTVVEWPWFSRIGDLAISIMRLGLRP